MWAENAEIRHGRASRASACRRAKTPCQITQPDVPMGPNASFGSGSGCIWVRKSRRDREYPAGRRSAFLRKKKPCDPAAPFSQGAVGSQGKEAGAWSDGRCAGDTRSSHSDRDDMLLQNCPDFFGHRLGKRAVTARVKVHEIPLRGGHIGVAVQERTAEFVSRGAE